MDTPHGRSKLGHRPERRPDTARLAPDHPMGHALALGFAGLVVSIVGAVAMWDFGPNWYPLALVALAMPCAGAGGQLRVMQLRARGL